MGCPFNSAALDNLAEHHSSVELQNDALAEAVVCDNRALPYI